MWQEVTWSPFLSSICFCLFVSKLVFCHNLKYWVSHVSSFNWQPCIFLLGAWVWERKSVHAYMNMCEHVFQRSAVTEHRMLFLICVKIQKPVVSVSEWMHNTMLWLSHFCEILVQFLLFCRFLISGLWDCDVLREICFKIRWILLVTLTCLCVFQNHPAERHILAERA